MEEKPKRTFTPLSIKMKQVQMFVTKKQLFKSGSVRRIVESHREESKNTNIHDFLKEIEELKATVDQ
jgi:hypothetical protein